MKPYGGSVTVVSELVPVQMRARLTILSALSSLLVAFQLQGCSHDGAGGLGRSSFSRHGLSAGNLRIDMESQHPVPYFLGTPFLGQFELLHLPWVPWAWDGLQHKVVCANPVCEMHGLPK